MLHLDDPRNQPNAIAQEVTAIRRLCDGRHPNLVLLLRSGELKHAQYYYFDMELCDISLYEYIYLNNDVRYSSIGLDRFDRLSSGTKLQRIWGIMEQIASGVAFIHQENFTHRDLKPSNSNPP